MNTFWHKTSWILAITALAIFANADASHAKRPDNAPKLAFWDFSWDITEQDARDLSQADVIIVDVETAHYTPRRLTQIKELNPDIKILAYVSFVDIRTDAATLDEGTTRKERGDKIAQSEAWILREADGDSASFWPGNYIMNITNSAPRVNGQRYNEWFPEYFEETVIDNRKFDGVFFDNCWETTSFVSDTLDFDRDGRTDSTPDKKWRAGMKTMLSNIRTRANRAGRKKFIMSCNGGTAYSSYVNGVGFEHAPENTPYGEWTQTMDQYDFILRNARTTRYAFLNTNGNNASNARTNYKKMRYGLTSALLGDGFFNYDKGDQSHREPDWYYDEYDVNLGEPVTTRYNLLRKDDPQTLRAGVWARQYERATVFVNSTNKKKKLIFKTRYERIKGKQSKKVNSGKNAGSITLKPKDGIILLRRLRLVSNITFVNGAQAKVFNQKGRKVRNSFFSYDGNFPAGAQVHRIAITKKNGKTKRQTVVASGPYVQIYNKNGRKIRQWAPYGESYTGTVNISVGQAKKKRKRFIVTGRSSDVPEVKIYNLKGRQQSSCIPYDAAFRGGVNVGTGNLRGGRRDEIVVSAAYGGGPHVRVLNAGCKLIDPGFFAFSKNLRNGVNMAVGNIDGRGKPEVITATGAGSSPKIRIYRKKGKTWKRVGRTFRPYSKSDTSGVLVSAIDIDDNGKDEIVTSSFSIFNSF